jgi:ABC-type Fe3+/spermidine/putrescine transport system ATPase subunit
VRLDRVTKRFGTFTALDDLSLEIYRGEILTLLGPSGCGKTTTLRILAGLEHPDAGDLWMRDRLIVSVSKHVFTPPNRRDIGMVFQSYAIWPHMTVFENVAYPLRVRRVGRSEIRERVLRALSLVGLEGVEQRQGPNLSGGQQQRVALARALVYEPSVLLMDEPFSNLDAKLREQMRVQVKLLLKRLTDVTVVFVTHDQVEALSLSDRVVLMNRGRVEQVGPPRHLYERPATAFGRDFLGRTLLLRGRIQESEAGDSTTIRLDTGGAHLKIVEGAQDPSSPGSEVLVAIRPEDIELRVDDGVAAAANELSGTVEALLFVGEHYECRVRVGDDASVLLKLPKRSTLREGQAVRLTVAPLGISVWPA